MTVASELELDEVSLVELVPLLRSEELVFSAELEVCGWAKEVWLRRARRLRLRIREAV